jgi:putative adenylate-forming enzyme
VLEAGTMLAAYLKTRLRRRAAASAIERRQLKGMRRHPDLGVLLSGASSLNEALSRLPLIDANMARDRFAELNRYRLDRETARGLAEAERMHGPSNADGLSFGLSSGTTGEAGVFITTAAERAAFIGTILGKVVPPGRLLGCRVALLLRHGNALYADLDKTRLLRLFHFDIAVSMPDWIEQLCALAPHVIAGPPSMLLAVAREPAFRRNPLRPHTLLAGAEPLFRSEQDLLTAAYGVSPLSIYQASEGFIAVACGHGRLHVNEDILVAEWQRFRNSPQHAVPVITDFTRRSQRVWRLRLDDVVRVSAEPCPCGSSHRVIAAVEGRLGDILYSVSERGTAPLFPFVLEETLGPLLDRSGEWQVRQVDPERVVVATQSPLDPPQWRDARDLLASLGGWPDIACSELAPRPPQLKRRRFVRAFDPLSRLIVEEMLLPPDR